MISKRNLLLATVGTGAAIALVAALGFAPGEASAERDATPIPAELRRVTHADGYTIAEQFAGRIAPRRSSSLGFERNGTLTIVHFDEGDRVDAGQVLAELDVRALDAQRAEIDAQAAEVRARLELAQVTTERRRNLHASGHLSSQRLDEAIAAEREISARLAAVLASREKTDVALALSKITAPYAGTIDVRHVDEGTVVNPGQSILELIEDRMPEARIGVPPATAATLAIGGAYPIAVDGRTVDATLASLSESVAPDTRTVTAVFSVDAQAGVRAGALARVELTRRIESSGFWLPLSGLTEGSRGLWSAYVVAADGRGRGIAERRQLEVLHTESDRAFVRGTLHDGETIVASGLHRIVPGLEVRVADSPGTTARTLQ